MTDSDLLLIDLIRARYVPVSEFGGVMKQEIYPEWYYLEINDRLRVSVKINVTEDLTDEEKELFAQYQYMRMTFQDVTRAA